MDPEHGLTTDAPWSSVLVSARKALLEVLLPDYLRGRRWFSAKARTIAGVRIVQAVPFAPAPDQAPLAYLTFLQVQYAEGDKQTFVLPLAYAAGEDAAQIQETLRQAVVTPLQVKGEPPGVLYDATSGAGFAPALLDAIKQDRRFGDAEFEIHTWPTAMFAQIEATGEADRCAPRRQAEQSNTSIVFGRDFILKLFRRLEQGTSPDLEIGRFLTEQGFAHIPPLAGAVERTVDRPRAADPGDPPGLCAQSWRRLELHAERAGRLLRPRGRQHGSPAPGHRAASARSGRCRSRPAAVRDALRPYDKSARLLGQRTAQLHVALAADKSTPAFAPEPFDACRTSARSYDRCNGWCRCLRAAAGARWGAARPDAPGRRRRDPAAQRDHGRGRPLARPRIGRPADPLPRRLSPGPGTLYRQRFRDHRLRGRADPLAGGAPRRSIPR